MSKYTTEIRFICENASGLVDSVGYKSVNEVIEKARPKVFDFPYPIFDEAYRSILEKKILKHYYTREIAFETVGLFKLKLDTMLNEIMPYYNQLYKSELLEFNPLYDVDVTRTHEKEATGTANNTGTLNANGTAESEATSISNTTGSTTGKFDGNTTGTTGGTNTTKNNQYLLINSEFDAIMDVEVLASAFNLSKAEFMGHRVLVDSFGSLDVARLNLLFANNPTYTQFTQTQLDALDAIPAIIVDKDWFMIFDNFYNFTEQYNGEGLYWNYWYHVWKTFSISPFMNNAMFVPGTPTVTSVTVSPATATVEKGQSLNLSATVVTTNFAPKAVNWSIDSDSSTIDNSGNLHVSPDETATTITVTATSTFDDTKDGDATITVAS